MKLHPFKHLPFVVSQGGFEHKTVILFIYFSVGEDIQVTPLESGVSIIKLMNSKMVTAELALVTTTPQTAVSLNLLTVARQRQNGRKQTNEMG